ncbi:glycerol-3-phosphate dehydrogenase subunit GlpB [Natronobiforma cellulositropha]|uniref:glycerol-3-phosphate dehydrogenase subunit GlpB n=1 Tax=Natronobiforma cellulositropha TaxID=1679076 RepID=UPI0021D60AAB|nr:glycerol-3-phosphate dehydrogenase subunit GlpB [Natronobiforma cellulositropha]
MAIEDDVLVVGGGLAGLTAALAAADTGARVRLISHKRSTLRHASGLIDVLGYGPDGRGPLVDPFEALESLPETHPYARVGSEIVREALHFFDAVVGDAYGGCHTTANALVPTADGTVKPTARYPASVAAGLASDARATLLVGFETVTDLNAPLVAAGLEASGVPFPVRGETVPFPGGLRDDATRTRYARALDQDERVEAGSVRVRTALAEAIRSLLRPADRRLGLPALLGLENAAVVRRDLEERLGVAVFELPTGPPSLPGERLERLLFDALEAAGVRVTTGVPVVDFETESDDPTRIARVFVDRNGARVPHRAYEYVLATGGLVGKGIRSSRAGVREPVFGCPVAHPDERIEWSAAAPFGEHAFARFGLETDGWLRPLETDGSPVFANLRAAGAVLGGYDFPAECSGSGVSLATGYAAGREAGLEVSA